jgi:hypothetical protein
MTKRMTKRKEVEVVREVKKTMKMRKMENLIQKYFIHKC